VPFDDQPERLTDDEREQLRQLFESVEEYRGGPDDPLPDLDDPAEPYLVVGGMETLVLFRGQALSCLNSVVSQHARSSLEHGGHSPHSVHQLVIDATRRHLRGESSPVDWFEEQLFRHLDEYLLVEPTDVFTQFHRLTIGNCDLVGRMSDLLPAELSEFDEWLDSMHKRALIARLSARDKASATLIARDRFDETHSILAVLAPSADLKATRATYMDPETQMINGWSPGRAISPLRFVDDSGELYPGYRQLSDAVRKTPGQRTEWERRVIAATRWHYLGRINPWATAELAAYMASLECVLIKQHSRGKGDRIARVINELSPNASVEVKRKLRRRLPPLYNRRNDALHEGISFQDDIELSRLRALCSSVLGWAISHLDPWHRGVPDGPCTTFAAAHSSTHDRLADRQSSRGEAPWPPAEDGAGGAARRSGGCAGGSRRS
jgi:hypothetical protein